MKSATISEVLLPLTSNTGSPPAFVLLIVNELPSPVLLTVTTLPPFAGAPVKVVPAVPPLILPFTVRSLDTTRSPLAPVVAFGLIVTSPSNAIGAPTAVGGTSSTKLLRLLGSVILTSCVLTSEVTTAELVMISP